MSAQAHVVDGMYGASSGPGPFHLLADGPAGVAPLCGVRRFRVYAYLPPGKNVCTRCGARRLSQMRAERKVAIEPIDQARLADISAALDALRAARERIARMTAELRGASGPLLDGYLHLLNESGYSLREIGELLGCTGERVRQRIAAHAARSAT